MADHQSSSPTSSPSSLQKPLDVFTQRLLLTAVLVIGLLLAWATSGILLLVFGGILLGILLHGLAQLLSRVTRLPEHSSLFVVTLLILLLLAALGWFISPNLSAQITQLQAQWPQALAGLKQKFSLVHGGQWLFNQLYQSVHDIVAQQAQAQTGHLFIQTIGMAGSTLVVLFLGFYLAYSPRMYVAGLLHLIPPVRRAGSRKLLEMLGQALFRWVIGRLIGMVILGIFLWLGLWLLGVKLSITLALMAMILDFVPYIGSILATIPALLVALLQSPMQAVYVLALYVTALNLEGYLIEPLIERKAVYLPPTLTLIAQMLMYQLFGLVGMFLAMPLMATLYTAVRKLYVENILGDQLDEE